MKNKKESVLKPADIELKSFKKMDSEAKLFMGEEFKIKLTNYVFNSSILLILIGLFLANSGFKYYTSLFLLSGEILFTIIFYGPPRKRLYMNMRR